MPTLRQSAIKEHFVEILFEAKPDEQIRNELKAAGFRWAMRNACWYGPKANLPERYKSLQLGESAPVAQETNQNSDLMAKVERFRAMFEQQYNARMKAMAGDTETAKFYNPDGTLYQKCTIKVGRKYINVDRDRSGHYMVDMASGEIMGIKSAYGVPHPTKRYGTLDTIDEWDWGPYHAEKKSVAPKLEAGHFWASFNEANGLAMQKGYTEYFNGEWLKLTTDRDSHNTKRDFWIEENSEGARLCMFDSRENTRHSWILRKTVGKVSDIGSPVSETSGSTSSAPDITPPKDGDGSAAAQSQPENVESVVPVTETAPVANPAKNPAEMAGIEKFMEVYSRALMWAVTDYPEEYPYGVHGVRKVVEGMREAIIEGSFNKEGRAFKRTCKELGIKHTYGAIKDFITEKPEPGKVYRLTGPNSVASGATLAEAEVKPETPKLLQPMSALQYVNPLKEVVGAKDSKYITDGRVLFVRDELTDASALEPIAYGSWRDGKTLPDEKAEYIIRRAPKIEDLSAALHGFVSGDQIEHKYSYVAVVEIEQKGFALCDAHLLRLIKLATNYNSITGIDGKNALSFFRDKKLVAIAMPLEADKSQLKKVIELLDATKIAQETGCVNPQKQMQALKDMGKLEVVHVTGDPLPPTGGRKPAPAIDEKLLRLFIGKNQWAAINIGLQGEEKQFFMDKLAELTTLIRGMPKTKETESIKDPITHLHYFAGGQANWWITEKDMGCDGDITQHQAFGLADLFGDGGEIGYISIAEIISNGGELDFYWTAKPLSEVREFRNGSLKYPLSPAGETAQNSERKPMSWKLGCKGKGDSNWAYNALRFATKDECESYGSDLSCRWMGLDQWEAHECDDPVTHRWGENGVEEIKAKVAEPVAPATNITHISEGKKPFDLNAAIEACDDAVAIAPRHELSIVK